jgi:hypothetical protein
MAEQFNIELADMEKRQREEQKKLLDLKEKGYADELQLLDLHHAHILEKEKILAEQRAKAQTAYLGATKNVLGNVASAFNDYYKATGEKHKAFFAVYKAASIAETMIGTYQAAQSIYASTAKIPYVGQYLAPAAAAAAIAAGIARVSLIQAQSFARGGLIRRYNEGGKIMGYSPTDTADNIPINATAGEYVQPVKSVKHYGIHAMEAIRQRLVPPDVFAPFVHAGSNIPIGTRLAYGGAVAASNSNAASYSVNVPITTIDTMDGLVGRMQGAAELAVRKLLDEELG